MPAALAGMLRLLAVPLAIGEGCVAIDNSATSPSKGALYVAEAETTVKKFVVEGGEYKLKGELSASPALETANCVAVDSKGDVFVADKEAEAVVEFDPTGAEAARLDVSASVGEILSLALDSAGDLFAVGYTNHGVFRFAANGSGEIEAGTEAEQIVAPGNVSPANGVAVDLSTDSLYVVTADHGAEYAAACTPGRNWSG